MTEIIAQDTTKAKANSAKSPAIAAAVQLYDAWPRGLIYPAWKSTKAPAVKRWNKRRLQRGELLDGLQRPGCVPAIMPASFGLLALDIDEGAHVGIVGWLADHGVDCLPVQSARRGWHIYVRCELARLPKKFAGYGAWGDFRYANNVLLYRDTPQQLLTMLSLPSAPFTAAMRDEIVARDDGGAGPYGTVAMEHGRAVYVSELKGDGAPGWAGAIARLEGMQASAIIENEGKALAAAQARLNASMKWARARTAGAGYRGSIVDTLAAMVALATSGNCWASHKTICAIADVPWRNRNLIRRHLDRLEQDGWIVRLPEVGQSYRGKASVVWQIVGLDDNS